MEMRIKKLEEHAVLPKRQTQGSVGYDLHACLSRPVKIPSGERRVIPTGIAVELPRGHGGLIFTRSGLGVKFGVHVSNGVGVIDWDYRGEIQVALTNSGKEAYEILPGDRVAQLVIVPVALPTLLEVPALSETERGAGRFGSTGTGLSDGEGVS